jgi:2-dehydropantoate 2-reductase
VAATALEAFEQHGPFDYILVACKALPDTAPLIGPALTPHHTTIVLAQNGIDIEPAYTTLYPTNPLISGVVYLPTTQVAPGIIEHTGALERFEIGPAALPQTRNLADLFAAAGASAPTFPDIQPRRWMKLAVNASFNPLTALTLCDDANFLRSSPRAVALARDVMREVRACAAAAGYPGAISDDEVEVHLARHVARMEDGGKEPSMLVDVRCGRRIEVEAILGNAVRVAERGGVDVPYLKMLYVLAKARDFSLAQDGEWKPIRKVE